MSDMVKILGSLMYLLKGFTEFSSIPVRLFSSVRLVRIRWAVHHC